MLIGIMVFTTVAHAATYEWTDSQGGLHFTDDLDKVPVKYSNKVRKLDIKPVIQEKEQPSQPERNSIDPSAQNLFGGHDEMWWRSNFRALRDEMKSIQDNLQGKRDRLNELRRKLYIFSKPSDRIAYNDMHAEIEKDEARVAELQKMLTDLESESAKAGVPLEWRK
jgi:bacterioferritin (cytochrome b1)